MPAARQKVVKAKTSAVGMPLRNCRAFRPRHAVFARVFRVAACLYQQPQQTGMLPIMTQHVQPAFIMAAMQSQHD